MSITDQIRLLIELQKLDSQIFKFNRELENQPVLLRKLDEEFKSIEAALKQKEEELKALLMRKKQREMDLQGKEDAIKKLQAQLYQIKTNKEYQAMEKEIASQRADISVIEEDILKIFDQIDVCTAAVNKEKEILNEHRKTMDSDKEKINSRTESFQAALGKLKADRSAIAQKSEKVMLAKYERILNSKDGLAMVGVIGNACGACHINLPPQVINEIKLKQELIFCGSCARILYIEEDEQPTP